MNKFKCIRCGIGFDSQGGLNTHNKRYCDITPTVTRLLERRQVNLERKANEKRRRLEESENVHDDSGDGSHHISESYQPTLEEEMMMVDQVGRLKFRDILMISLLRRAGRTNPPQSVVASLGSPKPQDTLTSAIPRRTTPSATHHSQHPIFFHFFSGSGFSPIRVVSICPIL
jgi:hypothetical protein